MLARAVALVAALPLPEADRAAVLDRVVAAAAAAAPPAVKRPDVRVLSTPVPNAARGRGGERGAAPRKPRVPVTRVRGESTKKRVRGH
jgi:hypothetical protein